MVVDTGEGCADGRSTAPGRRQQAAGRGAGTKVGVDGPGPSSCFAAHPLLPALPKGGKVSVALLLGDHAAPKGLRWDLGPVELPPDQGT